MKESFGVTSRHPGAKRLARINSYNDIIEEYAEKGYRLTIRQLFYQLVSRGMIENTRNQYTDISRDGMLQGPSISLYRKLVNDFPNLEFIASGGVSGINDVLELNKIGVSGIIIGEAYYEGRITIDEIKKLIKDLK